MPAVDVPPTHYARSGQDGTPIHIAYQVLDRGGPHTVVWLPPFLSNIEVVWENAHAARFFRRLAGLGRLVHFDKRGQGLSDRDTGVPTIDQRVDDLVAVLDAAGVERAVLAGSSEGGSTAAMFAASHPERVSHLVLYGTFAAMNPDAGHSPLTTPENLDRLFERIAATWATPDTLTASRVSALGIAGGQTTVDWINRLERQSTSPGALIASFGWIRRMDVTSSLAAISVPTLVVHSTADRLVPVDAGRYVADHIPGARFVVVDGVDHMPWFGDQDAVLRPIEEFVTGESRSPQSDRLLATVVFTDIVESTSRAAAMGDAAWRRVLDDHDSIVHREVERGGGRVVKSTGDGSLSTFDRPGRALDASLAISDAVRAIGIDVRIGVHTGEVERRDDDVAGIAVHLAARVCDTAGAGEILVSRTVTDLVVGSGHGFADRGEHELKGIAGRWQLFAVER